MITFDLNTYISNTTDYGGKYILYEVGQVVKTALRSRVTFFSTTRTLATLWHRAPPGL